VAKFFKYKSAADLAAENARLNLDLRFSDDLSPLWQPLNVGPRTLGNRWCIHPMEGCDGARDGSPDELTFRRYVRFGAGGAKLIWGEACAVSMTCRANPRQIVLNDRTKAAFARIVDDTRKAHRDANGSDSDLLFGLQLTHSGRYSHPRPIIATHDPILDPRTVADKATGARVDAAYPLITDDELRRLIDDYIATAKLAVEVGFDFIDVPPLPAERAFGSPQPPRSLRRPLREPDAVRPRGVSGGPRRNSVERRAGDADERLRRHPVQRPGRAGRARASARERLGHVRN
jgi:NADPH2 dehydrogenase